MIIKRKEKMNIVPDVHAITREMTSSSQMKIVLSRFLSLPLKEKVLLAQHNVGNLLSLAKKDFAAGVILLCELEILKKKLHVGKKTIFLHSQMTDMGLALKNKHVFLRFFTLAKTYGFTPGIVTHNPEAMIQMLSYMHIPKNIIIATSLQKTPETFKEFAVKSHISFVELKGQE